MARLTFTSRKNSHSVVRLLAKHQALVATLLKYICRKLVVSALGLLHAKNIRLDGVEPAGDAWQPCQYRIDVPSCYSHRVGVLDSRKIKSLVIYHLTFLICHLKRGLFE